MQVPLVYIRLLYPPSFNIAKITSQLYSKFYENTSVRKIFWKYLKLFRKLILYTANKIISFVKHNKLHSSLLPPITYNIKCISNDPFRETKNNKMFNIRLASPVLLKIKLNKSTRNRSSIPHYLSLAGNH